MDAALAKRIKSYMPAGLDETECWPWQGLIDISGYGRVRTHQRGDWAHRWVFALAHGLTRPPDGVIMHICDNRQCCNPAHLRLGTHSQNFLDMWAKGRARPATRRGEAHGGAKLTTAQVAEIRATGGDQRTLARRYGVSQSTIWRILRGKNRNYG